MNKDSKYEDIIHLPHHRSKKHLPMPPGDRAAQFAPFAALVGHDAAIAETARITESKIELDESMIAALDAKLQLIRANLQVLPIVHITYFIPDARKSGGAYTVKSGSVKKIDELQKALIMQDGTVISISDISDIQGEIFPSDHYV